MSGDGTRFEPLSAEELDEFAREQYARAFPKREGPPPRARNVRATRLLVGAEQLAIEYRDVQYELLPVEFADGVLLAECRARVEAIEDESKLDPMVVRDYLVALRKVVALAPKYLRPLGRVRRLLWRLGIRKNPYRRATEAEIGQLLGFFLGCRMRSRVRYPGT
jgi:hypothetical protein